MAKILVVDDEPVFRDTLAFNLSNDGYEVLTAAEGMSAVEIAASTELDLILLDLMLPGISGIEVCKRIRKHSQVPIIMVTAKDDEIDKVVGLEVGADDYLTKPYSYRELVARIRAVLRRSSAENSDEEAGEVLRVGHIEMDTGGHEVSVSGEDVQMPLREFELLELFMNNPDRVLTRSQILDRIWGLNYIGDTKTLDVHVKRIRAKIEKDPGKPTVLVTVRGLGYKLVSSAE
ncbi:MAG: response regulator [Ancrocorticia sp.]|uniref:response regulator n=1 Tax=Ancrocorticia sp. TaxID=2593684 RepID=UPI003F91231A